MSAENVLENIINNAQSDKYRSFQEFCIKKDKGLRKESFLTLDTFINEFWNFDKESQKEFIIWLFEVVEISENINRLLVHPLVEKVIKPFLESWISEARRDPRPYRWYGVFLNTQNSEDYLKFALEIGGVSEQRVLITLINLKLYALWYSFHHISEDLYLGDIVEDKKIIADVNHLILDIQNSEIKQEMLTELRYYDSLLNDWLDFRSEMTEGFVQWCKKRERNYEWVKSYYY